MGLRIVMTIVLVLVWGLIEAVKFSCGGLSTVGKVISIISVIILTVIWAPVTWRAAATVVLASIYLDATIKQLVDRKRFCLLSCITAMLLVVTWAPVLDKIW